MKGDEKEVWFSVSKAHLYFPDRIAPSTIRNWISKGVVCKTSGKLVYLKTRQVGGRIFTSVPSYYKFIEDLNKDER